MADVKQISSQLTAARAILRKGGVVVVPSESSYGLFTPIRSTSGIKRILRLKGRQDNKFTVVASSLKQVQKFFPAARTDRFTRIAQAVWPGPVSVVVSPRMSVRVPDSADLRHLAQAVGQPLVATSANASGQPAAYSLAQVSRQLDVTQVDAVVDGGTLPKRKPSAVVKVGKKGIEVLREGPERVNRTLKRLYE